MPYLLTVLLSYPLTVLLSVITPHCLIVLQYFPLCRPFVLSQHHFVILPPYRLIVLPPCCLIALLSSCLIFLLSFRLTVLPSLCLSISVVRSFCLSLFPSFRRGPQLRVLEDIEVLIGDFFHGPCLRLSEHRSDFWPHIRHRLREYGKFLAWGAAEGSTALVWWGRSGA